MHFEIIFNMFLKYSMQYFLRFKGFCFWLLKSHFDSSVKEFIRAAQELFLEWIQEIHLSW